MAICKDDIKKISTILLISIAGGIILTFFSCESCYSSFYKFSIISIISSVCWFLIWIGNSFIGNFINNRLSWSASPVKRLIIGSTAVILYTTIAIIVLMEIFAILFNIDYGRSYTNSIYTAIVITILISLFLNSRSFYLSWQQATIDAEKLQKENILAKYESLKSQVNPHFLFNSLNALTNIVYDDRDKAVKFIKQLSEVYRYVLDTKDREVVTVEEELRFIDSYLFLQKIRFGDSLKTQINISSQKTFIAPLALQMLIENAIKHNIVSSEDPLLINILEKEDYIMVENNLQKKTALGETSSNMGLENICKRYDFLSNKKVEILKSEDKFTVKLPIIRQ